MLEDNNQKQTIFVNYSFDTNKIIYTRSSTISDSAIVPIILGVGTENSTNGFNTCSRCGTNEVMNAMNQTFLENTWEGEPAFYLQSIARTKSYTYYLYTVNI